MLVVSLVALQRSTHDPTWSGFFTYLALAGAVYLGIGGYLARRLRPVPQYSQQPSPGLGRWVHGTIIDAAENEQKVEGFLVDVALGVGLQVLQEPQGKALKVPLMQASKLQEGTRALCSERCERWIPQCERGKAEDERLIRTTEQITAATPESPSRGLIGGLYRATFRVLEWKSSRTSATIKSLHAPMTTGLRDLYTWDSISRGSPGG